MPPDAVSEEPLWAITSYYNPLGYDSRLNNYHRFREGLSVPLIAVEWSCDGNTDLGPGDADVLIQVESPDVLWQKERLLNLALEAVPRSCTAIAWLDCDLVFEEADWAQRAVKLLDTFPLVQPFSTLYEMPWRQDQGKLDPKNAYASALGIMSALSTGAVDRDVLRGNLRLTPGCASGGAWVASREVLEAHHNFYDACILGSGNRAMFCAAVNRFDDAIDYLVMNESWAEHYRIWARSCYEAIRGDIGFTEGCVFHLWHGNLADRNYAGRHKAFQRFAFDPYQDIAIAPSGCWRWDSVKHDMHQYVGDYFKFRREDVKNLREF
jgi:hypothetical protein